MKTDSGSQDPAMEAPEGNGRQRRPVTAHRFWPDIPNLVLYQNRQDHSNCACFGAKKKSTQYQALNTTQECTQSATTKVTTKRQTYNIYVKCHASGDARVLTNTPNDLTKTQNRGLNNKNIQKQATGLHFQGLNVWSN